MRKTLTDKGVTALKPRPKRYSYPDPELRGLWIRIQPSGAKSFAAVTCSPDGRQIWASIGAADAMPIAVARERAKAILQRVRSGLPPVEPKAETFGAVVATWRKRHVEANGLRSAPEINRLLAAHILPAWKDREFTSIRRSDVASLLDKVEDKHGARAADYVLNITRAVMNWYATRSDDYVPPLVRGMKRQKTMPRFRVLDDDELRSLWRASESAGSFGALVRLCLLTAQRSRKVATMKWADLDLESGVWMIPKAAREKDSGGALALPGTALDIIRARPLFASNPHVFPGRGGDGPFRGFGASKATLDSKLPQEMSSWTIHDLRRSARSLMARAGVRPDVAERVMGHAIRGVEGVYDRHRYFDEKRAALAKLAALLDSIINPRDSVVPLRKPAKARR